MLGNRFSAHFLEYPDFVFQMIPVSNIAYQIQYLIIFIILKLQENSYTNQEKLLDVGRLRRQTCSGCRGLKYSCFPGVKKNIVKHYWRNSKDCLSLLFKLLIPLIVGVYGTW